MIDSSALQTIWGILKERASGGMVDALVLGTSVAMRGGSSPLLPKYLKPPY